MGTSKARTAAKPAKKPEPEVPSRRIPPKTFIIDNGAYTMKAGYASDATSAEEALSACTTIPNCLVKTRDNRIVVGPQISSTVNDWNEAMFRRPVEKGYLVNWEAEREIWEQSFFEEKATARNKGIRIPTPEDTTLVLTEAPNTMPVLQRNTDEMVMEEWGFGGYVRCLGPTLNAWNEVHSLFGDPLRKPETGILPADCLFVVDSGYSHTTVTPVYRGLPIQRAIRRLDIGGKHLTNYLKEIVSMRQYNMVDESYIMNEVKESVCFVTNDFTTDMEKTWKANLKRQAASDDSIVVDFVLPDPNANKKGFMRPHDPLLEAKKKKGALSGLSSEILSEDVLVLGNERFAVPELLFRPSDIGMKQAGVPEMILQSLSVLPAGLHAAFLANVFVVGGNAGIPGFMERLETELRQITSSECVVRVRRAEDPICSTWLGGSRLATNREELSRVAISRQEYQEYGSGWAGRRFAGNI
ncbi:unnamed protein product [Penicillium manginii]